MSIRPVTYYEAWCEVCGRCEMGEYASFADEGQVTDWVNDGDGLLAADGRLYCSFAHLPPELCRCHDDNVHVFDADGDCDCGAESLARVLDDKSASSGLPSAAGAASSVYLPLSGFGGQR